MSLKKAKEIATKCIDEMYQHSTPPTTWEKIMEKYGNTKIRFYEKHMISEKDYDRIKAKYEKKLPALWKKRLAFFLLDYAPKSKHLEKKRKNIEQAIPYEGS